MATLDKTQDLAIAADALDVVSIAADGLDEFLLKIGTLMARERGSQTVEICDIKSAIALLREGLQRESAGGHLSASLATGFETMIAYLADLEAKS